MQERLEVFWFSGSQPAWRVMLALELKGIPYTSRLLEASAKEHKKPDFLDMNPRGKTPIVKHGENVVRESWAILAYLDRLQPSPPLFGSDAATTGAVWEWIFDFEQHLGKAMGEFTRIVFRNQLEQRAADAKDHVARAKEELEQLPLARGEQLYVLGESISAADVALFPALQRVRRAIGKLPETEPCRDFDRALENAAGLAGWEERIKAVPGYENTYPPHWREPG